MLLRGMEGEKSKLTAVQKQQKKVPAHAIRRVSAFQTQLLPRCVFFPAETQCVHVRCTYREQHNGNSQSDGSEDSQAHQQQHGVKLIDLGEGVEQLCLHIICVRGRNKKKHISGLKQHVRT